MTDKRQPDERFQTVSTACFTHFHVNAAKPFWDQPGIPRFGLSVRLYWMWRNGWEYSEWIKFGSHAQRQSTPQELGRCHMPPRCQSFSGESGQVTSPSLVHCDAASKPPFFLANPMRLVRF
jgi:hypothetical protein